MDRAGIVSSTHEDHAAPPARGNFRLLFSYILPAGLALLLCLLVLRQEYVAGVGWEFAEYGTMARNLWRGGGAVSSAMLPYDLALKHDLVPSLRPPMALHNRNLLPVGLMAVSIKLFGERDGALILPHILAFLAFVLLTNHVERRCLPGTTVPVAATLLACSPKVLFTALECYPNVLYAAFFVPFLLLIGRMEEGSIGKGTLGGLFLLSGLSYLTRADFLMALPLVLGYGLWRLRRRGVPAALLAVVVGFGLWGSLEWVYSLRNFGTALRSDTLWTNLANLKYKTSWLCYVRLEHGELWRDYGGALLRRGLAALPASLRALAALQVSWFGAPGKVLGILLMAVGGIALLARGPRRPGSVTILFVLLLVVQHILVFTVTSPGTLRYLYWTLPLFGVLLHAGLRAVLNALEAAFRGGRQGRWAGVAAGIVVLAVATTATARAYSGKLRFYVGAVNAYYSAEHSDPAMRDVLEQSLAVNYPALRDAVPGEKLIMSDEPAVAWYADRLVLYLPLNRADFDAIEQDWFRLDYLYLGPTFWMEPEQPMNWVYRHYLANPGGLVPAAREEKLANFMGRFPEFTPWIRFENGGILFRRKSGG